VLQTPPAPRSTFSEQPEGLRISIPPPRSFVLGIFFVVWFAFWAYGGLTFTYEFWQGSRRDLFTFVWLGFFWIFTPVVTYYFVFSLVGRDILIVRPDVIAHRAELLGFARTHSYSVREMRNLRFVPEFGGGKSKRQSVIAFDYGAKTIRLASGIEEAEGNMVIDRILQRAQIAKLPSYTEL
jgi:hypothetical protein